MKRTLRSLACLALTLSLLLIPAGALSTQEALDLLDQFYIDGLPGQASQAQTLDELLGLLGDPYTVYLTEEEHQEFLASLNDTRLIGIGVAVENHEAGVLISSVLDDSPALEAGLAPGDIILSVDGVPVTNIDQARTLLTGEEGTSVTIHVRKADGSTVQLDLIRREIVVATTVQTALSADGNACVIICSSFGDETPDHIADALREYDSSVNGFIIDLSANPGGTSHSGAASAGCFIGSAVMLYLRDGQDQYSYVYTVPGTPAMTEKGAILLTGPYSASSTELFLGALRDHQAGIAIGQRTMGKGVAQIILDQASHPEQFDGDALKVTVYRLFSPKGTTNDKLGVMPTLLLSLENTYNAALLLCGDRPDGAQGHLKLELSGRSYYIHLDTALSADYRSAFVELLEALPLSARLFCDDGTGQFTDTTPQAAAQALGLTEYTPRTFSDLTDSPYAQSVNTLATYRLLGGYGDGTFHPEQAITRAEFCAMLDNVLGLKPAPLTQSRFVDVSVHDWYASAIHEINSLGLLAGYDDGFFHPDEILSQQEVVNILAKLSTRLNMYAYNRRNLKPTQEIMSAFSQFSRWAQHSAFLLDSCDVDLSSLTTPQDQATRGQAADLLCQLLTRLNILWP